MNSSLPILSRLLLAFTVLAVVTPCQREEGERLTPEQMKEMRERMADERRGGDDEKEAMRKREMANMTPEERLNRSMRRGAAQHCLFVATMKPEKLLPGESGVMMVSALLKGSTVMEAPARIEITQTVGAAPVVLGALTAHPAGMGTLAEAYMGRPVYDNTAIFEVPVTMNPDVKLGEKHTVAFDVKFDLHDGTSAKPVGRFLERISAIVEVGKALDPAVAPAAGQPRAQPAVEAVQPEVDTGATNVVDPDRAGDEEKVIHGADPAPLPSMPDPAEAEPPVESDTEDARPGVDAGGSGLPTPLLLGGGGLLLVVVVLLLARKK